MPTIDIPGILRRTDGDAEPVGCVRQAFGGQTKPKRMTVEEAFERLIDEEGDKL